MPSRQPRFGRAHANALLDLQLRRFGLVCAGFLRQDRHAARLRAGNHRITRGIRMAFPTFKWSGLAMRSLFAS